MTKRHIYIEHKQCLLFPMNFYELCLVLILHTLCDLTHCVQDLYTQYAILHILFDFTHYVHYIHIDSMQFQFLRERENCSAVVIYAWRQSWCKFMHY